MEKKFIMTRNSETASIFRKMGFTEISSGNDYWLFINEGKIVFETLYDVTYTDKMFF